MKKYKVIPGYYFCILPSGNRPEFVDLDQELITRAVAASYWDFGGGRIYRIPERDLKKLPRDEKPQPRNRTPRYLGNDDSGHSIYRMNYAGLRSFRKLGRKVWNIVWKNV